MFDDASDFNIFFSATSFYPGREAFSDAVLFPSRVNTGHEHLANVHDGDTEVESEDDWLSDPPPVETARTKKALEVMLVEVSTSRFYYH
jgi:hypothetical protein